MQTSKTLKRVLAAVMVAVMLITAIPFTFAADADESTIKDYMVVGAYSSSAIKWKVLEKKADGTLVLISDSTVAKEKYQPDSSKAFDYENSNLYAQLNANLSFTDAEKAALSEITMSYAAVVDGVVANKTFTTKYAIATLADYEKYGLAKSADGKIYWLADMSSTSQALYVLANGTGTKGGAAKSFANGNLRPMISIAANSYVEVPTVENLTITAADGKTAVKYAVTGTQLKLTLAADYSESDLVVKFGGVEAEGTDGVYTVGTGAMTVEGIEANPANLDAYKEAVAKAEALDEELFSADSWAALKEALSVDVSEYTVLEQKKVDDQTAAIEKAISNLKDAPAEFDAYNNAVINANQIVGAESLYNYNITVTEDINATYTGKTLYFAIKTELKKTDDILAMTYKQQDEVDAATKVLTDLCAATPFKDANIQEWRNAINAVNTLSTKTYDPVYIDNCKAAIAAIVAANDLGTKYDNGELDIRNQEEINAEVAKIKAVYADKDSHFIATDFEALDKALAAAAAYVEDNYYKDGDVEREEELGGTAAWEDFQAKYAVAKSYADNKAQYAAAYNSQDSVDSATAELIGAMNKLDSYVKLDDWDRFVKDVKYFFSDIQYSLEGIVDLLATVVGLLGMLFRGEIDLYGLFELLGVDQEVLDFLISIGITPPEEEVPEVTA